MGDVFNEQLVKQEASVKNSALKALIISATVILSFLSFVFLGQLAPIIVVVLAFGAYYGLSFFNVEYEYIYTNGELDIDVIYSKNRRKRMFSGDVGNFEFMSHVDDKDNDSYYNGAELTKNYGSGTTKDNTYRFVLIYKGKKTMIIFEPNEKLLQAISTKLSRRKFVRRG